ncbi:MAG: NAD-dependent epimerase/dehydratase family protein, partial [Thermoplasmata archaeon]|nr:NAD-dependent epimerase/dehydratase family protein [Thermoplasmata archaeon]
DAIRGDYVVGELENAINMAYENERPQLIIVEGQGALSHPAYVTGSRSIVMASAPSTVVLQHAPGRKYRSFHADELHLPNGTIDRELELIRVYAQTDIVGITLNHENLTRQQVEGYIQEYEAKYKVPAADMLVDGPKKVADAIVKRFF